MRGCRSDVLGRGGVRGNFGMLTVGDRIAVTLYSEDNPKGTSAAIKFGA